MSTRADRQLEVIEYVVSVLEGDIVSVKKNKYEVKEVKARIMDETVMFKNNDFDSIPFGTTVLKHVEMLKALGEKFNLLVGRDKSINVKPNINNSYEDSIYLMGEGLLKGDFKEIPIKEDKIKKSIDKKYELNLTSMKKVYNFTLYKLKSDIKVEKIGYNRYDNYRIVNVIKHEPNLERVIEDLLKQFDLNLSKCKFKKDIDKRRVVDYDTVMNLFKRYKREERSLIIKKFHSDYYNIVVEEMNKEYNCKD